MKLKRVANGDGASGGGVANGGGAQGGTPRQNEWADNFLRKEMASRRQKGWSEDDTVDVTDAFS